MPIKAVCKSGQCPSPAGLTNKSHRNLKTRGCEEESLYRGRMPEPGSGYHRHFRPGSAHNPFFASDSLAMAAFLAKTLRLADEPSSFGKIHPGLYGKQSDSRPGQSLHPYPAVGLDAVLHLLRLARPSLASTPAGTDSHRGFHPYPFATQPKEVSLSESLSNSIIDSQAIRRIDLRKP